MNINKILIPTDLSEKANAALRTADLFINTFDCTVDLMHVIPLSKYLGDSFDKIGIPLNMNKEIYPKLIENQRKELSAFANEHIKKKEKRGEYIVTIDRKPSDSILKQIKKGKYDLVIMSARGGHFSDFFHGSATDKVVRRSTSPVLTLTEQMKSTKINNILIPSDFSEHSLSALPMAFSIAKRLNANLEILYIIELYAYDVHGIEPVSMGVDEKVVYEGLDKRFKNYLDDDKLSDFTLEAHDEDRKYTLHQNDGDDKTSIEIKFEIRKAVAAHHEIVDYANENADLVVMSTHGRSGLSRMLLGSTAEQVIQHLQVPQLTIKPDLTK